MAYTFGAATTDVITCGTPALAGTWSVAIRLRVTALDSSTRQLVNCRNTNDVNMQLIFTSPNNLVALFAKVGTTEQATNWASGFAAGSIHTLIGTYDGHSLRIYADTDATAKATSSDFNGAAVQPGDAVFNIGNQASATLSAASTIYEVAWWPGTVLTGRQAATIGSGATVNVPTPSNLWGLHGNATDLVGSNHGTINGTTVATDLGRGTYWSWDLPVPGGAGSRVFNGSTDLVTVTQSASINDLGGSSGAGPRTLFCYVFPLNNLGEQTYPNEYNGHIISKYLTGGGWTVRLYNATTVTDLTRIAQGIIMGTTSGWAATPKLAVAKQRWWALACTFAVGDGGPRLWIGTESTAMAEVAPYNTTAGWTRQDLVGTVSDATQNLTIGAAPGADRTLDGRLAHLSLWATALTLPQLETLRRAPHTAIAGLTRAAYWAMPFSEGSGTLTDSSGNNNHGTPTGTTVASGPTPAVIPQPAFTDLPFFPLGAGWQPDTTFATWIARGCNTMYGQYGTDTDAWTAACNAANLYMIRPPRTNPADDASEPRLIAWQQPDEPEVAATYTPADALAAYATWKAAVPARPILMNFAGPIVQRLEGYDGIRIAPFTTYQGYIQAADWIGSDIYPVATTLSPNTGRLDLVGLTINQLVALSGARPQFAWIETANQGIGNNQAPTPGQVRAEMWSAIIHGARGLFFFPKHYTGGPPADISDNTPSDVSDELTAQNATITALASVLQTAVNPAGASAVVAPPLEAGWRVVAGVPYYFVVNLSPSAQIGRTVTLTGYGAATDCTVYGENRTESIAGGALTDDFAAYAVHIYTPLLAVPVTLRRIVYQGA